MYFDNPNLIISGALLPWPNQKIEERVIIIKNIRNGDLSYRMTRPSFNTPHTWGSGFMHYLYSTFNPIDSTYIFSYANYDHLVKTDIWSNEFEHYETISQNVDSVIPFSYKQFDTFTTEEMEQYFLGAERFWSITYDRYRNLYYRLVLTPRVKVNGKFPPMKMKAHMIILNDNFEKLGEVDIKYEDYDLSMLFVTPVGIYIPSTKKNNKDKNAITFDIFVPEIQTKANF